MNKILKTILTILIALAGASLPAAASYLPFNTNVNMNIGIGTSTPQGALTVMNGNVGIGTWVPATSLDLENGNILLSNNSGITFRTVAGAISATNILYYSQGNAIVINQPFTGLGNPISFRVNSNPVMQIQPTGVNNLGNVGIGTVSPFAALGVVGNIGIGTGMNSPYITTTPPTGGMIVQGNVGIGSLAPGTALDVNGTVRTTGLTLSQNPGAGYVLVGNGVGVGTWMAASTLIAGGGTNYWLNNSGGNVGISTAYAVGIGTTFVGGTGEAAFSVMNGNVGIGTWAPSANLSVVGGAPGTPFGLSVNDIIPAVLSSAPPGAGTNTLVLNNTVGAGNKSNQITFDSNGTAAWTISNDINSNGADNFAIFDSALSRLYIDSSGNVGLGTTIPQGGLAVMNGNVGIGTWVPSTLLSVGANAFGINSNGVVSPLGGQASAVLSNSILNLFNNNVSVIENSFGSAGDGIKIIGGSNPNSVLILQSSGSIGNGDSIALKFGNLGVGTTTVEMINGNVGIGSLAPGAALDVNGTVRMTGLTLSQNPGSGYVLVGNGVGVGTWMPASTLTAGSGTNYWLNDTTGNVGISTAYAVGIGTSFVGGAGESAFSVMNGNVGIGTWVPQGALIVQNGNVGIGTVAAGEMFFLSGGNMAATGSFGSGPAISLAGNGTWMFWYPKKGAFRSVVVDDGLGDSNDAHIGNYSVAMGEDSLASGTSSTSFGASSTTNNYASAFGNSAASGTYSSAMGFSSASGNYSTAGGDSVGIGTYSTSFGKSIADGQYSSAFGFGVAKADYSTAFGGTGLATGLYSTVFGTNAQVGDGTAADGKGDYSLAIGLTSNLNANPAQLSGVGSVAIFMQDQHNVVMSANNAMALLGGNMIINPATGIGAAMVSTPQTALAVMGNVGIGTFAAAGGNLIVNGGGNVGIGSLAPGAALDVNGTVRMTGLTLSQNPGAGYVLVGNGVGVGTWMASSTLATSAGTNYWLNDTTGNVGISTAYAVGIGTSFVGGTGEAALSVMNGNVGIGTWVPAAQLGVYGSLGIDIESSNNGYLSLEGNGVSYASGLQLIDNNSTAVGVIQGGTSLQFVIDNLDHNNGQTFKFQNGGGTNFMTIQESGNVGIGSLVPGTALDVNGTVRMTGLTLSQNPGAGYVLVGNGVGVGTWMPASTLTAGGGTNYWLNDTTGNVGISTAYAVGIGTSFVGGTGEGALAVMNGNVGIGTWVPALPFSVTGDSYHNGNIGIGTTFVGGAGEGALAVMNGNVGIGTWVPGSALFVGNGTITSFNAIENNGEGILAYTGNGKAIAMQAGTGNGNILYDNSGGFSFQALPRAQVLAGTSTSSGITMTIDKNGNVGIGTFAPSGQLIVIGGNVGIGSLIPGQALDVTGTVRAIGFTMSGQTPISGYVLTASDSNGDATWTAPGASGGWTVSGNNVYETSGGNVGIGTTIVNQAGLIVTNGNIGIGTWTTTALLQVGQFASINAGGSANLTGLFLESTNSQVANLAVASGANLKIEGGGNANSFITLQPSVKTGNGDYIDFEEGNLGIGTVDVMRMVNGNVGIGTSTPQGALVVTYGNVGIGTWVPGMALDVNGTVRTTGFTMSGQTPISGYVLTASDSSGDTTWTSPGAVGGWTVSGNNVYETSSGNVGIGTTIVNQAALTVMNGNVGIGTWNPGGSLVVKSGNVGIGTDNSPDATLEITQLSGTPPFLVSSTVTTSGDYLSVINGGNVGIGSTAPGKTLDIQGTVRDLGEFVNGNVGIGTAFVNGAGEAALTVMNGNVGIGTWEPAEPLDVKVSSNTDVTMGQGASSFQGMLSSTGYLVLNAPNTFGIFLGINTTPKVTIDTNGNVGIGTITPQTLLSVASGNVGIGTWTAGNSLSVIGGMGIGSATYASTAAPSNGIIVSGNVGIGSLAPGTALDVNGTARMTGFVLTGNGAAPGSVLVTTAIGMGTWMPINTIAASGAVVSSVANEIGYYQAPSNSQTIVGSASMVFNNGNVGLGTQSPLATLQVVGNIGIGTVANGDNFIMSSPAKGGMIVEGNVGIGSWNPTQVLDVKGTVKDTGELVNGNVGIGTSFVNGTGEGAISVMNGNVGIGTWTPAAQLDVEGTLSVAYFNGNVGIGTWIPAYNFDLVNETARERNVRRVNTIASSATPAIDTDTTDLFTITALAANITSFTTGLTGTPNNGDLLEIRILDNGTARTIAWGASFGSTTTTLPLTTVVSTTLRILLEYDSAQAKWECIGVT